MRTAKLAGIVLAAIVAVSPVIGSANADHLPPTNPAELREWLDNTKEQGFVVLSVTVLVLRVDSFSGCADGPVVAFAALPGQPATTQPIGGCHTLIVEKPAASDVQVAVTGGHRDLFCDWRPLQIASCTGFWVLQPEGAVAHLAIRGGTPGAVGLVAA